ncbi:rRNA methyltransferase, partial [Mycoplasmopsis pullorum]
KIDKKVIVFGNEGAGIDQEIDGLMDKSIYIPISFESLNVACAAAIVLNKLRNG